MNLKPLWTFMAAFFIAGFICLFIILRQGGTAEPDVIAYNDIACTIGEYWSSLNVNSLPLTDYKIDYAVLDINGNVIAATKDGLDTAVPEGIRHRDVILDIVANGKVVGNVIFANDATRNLQYQKDALLLAGFFLLLLPLLFCAGFALYLRRELISPFRRLDDFARRVAEGNLDIPLEMDRQNVFGPFTESFDLMRSELKRSRENEYLANQSKKELVASLSHDIKTPIASIQAITELMLVQQTDGAICKNLKTINEKAQQISALVTDLFHASLEELQKLKVFPKEESSAVLAQLLQAADYGKCAEIPEVPPCLLSIDRLRLAQVFDNIFINSYKYAGTTIDVEFSFEGKFFTAAISDKGPGAPEESLPLLCNKFYRGKNAQGKSGSGLGLYLARYLMKQAGGDLSCENRRKNGFICGFAVKVKVPLAGK